MQLLVGDVGGTKTHLAIYEYEDELICVREKRFPSQRYSSLYDIIQEFTKDQDLHIAKACFGVAGPVRNGRCYTTNLPWLIDVVELSSKLQTPDVFLLNDLEADAHGLLELSPNEFFELNKGNRRQEGNAALVSAGTGLGEAGLYWDGKKYRPFACEGGHSDFAPQSEEEVELFFYLKKKFGHVSYERVVSGPGLANVYEFLVETNKIKKLPEFEEKVRIKDKAEVISDGARLDNDEGCLKALNMMIAIYGAEAANCALKYFALSGVYLGGGIAPKLLGQMKDGLFMRAFISKGRFSSILHTVPVRVLLNKRTALIGAAAYALSH